MARNRSADSAGCDAGLSFWPILLQQPAHAQNINVHSNSAAMKALSNKKAVVRICIGLCSDVIETNAKFLYSVFHTCIKLGTCFGACCMLSEAQVAYRTG